PGQRRPTSISPCTSQTAIRPGPIKSQSSPSGPSMSASTTSTSPNPSRWERTTPSSWSLMSPWSCNTPGSTHARPKTPCSALWLSPFRSSTEAVVEDPLDYLIRSEGRHVYPKVGQIAEPSDAATGDLAVVLHRHRTAMVSESGPSRQNGRFPYQQHEHHPLIKHEFVEVRMLSHAGSGGDHRGIGGLHGCFESLGFGGVQPFDASPFGQNSGRISVFQLELDVGVEEPPPKLLRQLSSYRRLTGSHRSGQDQMSIGCVPALRHLRQPRKPENRFRACPGGVASGTPIEETKYGRNRVAHPGPQRGPCSLRGVPSCFRGGRRLEDGRTDGEDISGADRSYRHRRGDLLSGRPRRRWQRAVGNDRRVI